MKHGVELTSVLWVWPHTFWLFGTSGRQKYGEADAGQCLETVHHFWRAKMTNMQTCFIADDLECFSPNSPTPPATTSLMAMWAHVLRPYNGKFVVPGEENRIIRSSVSTGRTSTLKKTYKSTRQPAAESDYLHHDSHQSSRATDEQRRKTGR